ncbi:redoxin domain-containing protein [Methylobacterium sp. sgz302541]|uniref:redoxin domain-containing protein n=1 Tax=unclassified Methylobacterium TaxID=2615210 RepID=UPI003D3402F4
MAPSRRLILTAATAVLAASALPVAALAAGLHIGKPAPAFEAMDADGRSVRLSDFKGRTVVLEWTNHDCPFVRKHYESGAMQALQKRWTERGVVWLSVISSAPGEQGAVDGAGAKRLTVERAAAPSDVLLDPKGVLGRAYDARTTPHMYIVTGDGTLAYQGGIDDKPSTELADIGTARNYVEEALSALAAGKPVAATTTRPYGCTVKYAS